MNIKELAKKLGVSTATISRVINNSGYVSEATRRLVMEGIKKYNYIPNAIARSLSTKDSRSVGVIIPDIENEFFSSVIRGISSVAEKEGYNIHFMGSDENEEKEHQFLDIVERQRLDGVIITPVSETDEITRQKLEQFNLRNIPVVLVDRDIANINLQGVFVDNIKGAYEGVYELIKAGHSKIAIIKGPESSRPGRLRYEGYIKALKDYNIPILDEYIKTGNFRLQKAYECTRSLMNLEQPPTAIFTSNNLTTLGCIKYFTKHGIKVGKDISLLSFDDVEVLKIIRYNLSVIDRDAKLQGEEAMKMMLHSIQNKGVKTEIKKKKVPYKIILRGSEKLQ